MVVDSECDLQRDRLKEEMRIIDGEISRLHLQITALSDKLKWKYIRKRRIQRELSESH